MLPIRCGCYSKSIELRPKGAYKVFGNRSVVYLKVGKISDAIADAMLCVKERPEWAKGYLRLGDAQLAFGSLDKAIQTGWRASCNLPDVLARRR